MKRFLRSIAGKTVLFILCIVSACVLIASIATAALMIGLDFYTQDKQSVYESLVEDKIRSDLYDDLWNVISQHDDNALIMDDSQLVYQITDKNDTLIGKTSDAEDIKDWKHTYDFGVLKDDEGKIGDIFYSSIPADKNVEYYTVKVNIKESGTQANFYTFADTIVSRAYSLRYGIYPIGLMSLLIVVASFVALMSVSGRRNEDEQLHPGPLNRIPFDILTGIVLILFVLFVISAEAISNNSNDMLTITYIVSGFFVFMNIGLGMCMSMAVRIKQRNLIKGSFCYLIFKWVLKIINFIYKKLKALVKGTYLLIREIPLVWKTSIIVFGLAFIEFLIIVESYSDCYTTFWFLKNLIIIPLLIYTAICMKKLQQSGIALANGDLSYHVDTSRMFWDLKKHGDNLNSIGKGMAIAVNEQMKSERMKTELITNVSHDIKTPLTSIINYADLIGKEKTASKKLKEYTEVILRQSERLKRLIDDLVEASKASTGNLEVNLVPCDSATFVNQAVGEYQDRLSEAGLTLVTSLPDEQLMIMADGRRMWRIFDNLMNNIAKYAQKNTRVYLSLEKDKNNAVFTFRNTSREQLNISEDELMERFTRGDQSRNTEGNGLGLAIAKSMAELQNGELKLSIDGDLFKAILSFPLI